MSLSRSWLLDRLRAFGASDALLLKAMRFGMIGVLSGLVFAGVTSLFAGPMGVGPKLSSVAGYVASMPLNFIGNRRFSFRSQNGLAGDLARFVLLHACNILITTFAMGAVVDVLGLHYAFGIVAAVVLVPCVNFAVMNWWVFRKNIARPDVSRDTLKRRT
ncbi:polysaccharide synthesis protein GtrA [Azorhizobium oxalatiphilum]|uniref:Polysaccharide synthesis protein GtrA n=1 Tax=Azorhizobium oxalatiphilum TaxID=980631 RepID=A0A917C6R3_9HYPH|nr:GtrA family protein [Azorhizobium oxalatiphilum]GGF72947.1 polysaccharide synthesis protein GtrA [Azorhizobium oxalatiphilum]